MDQDIHVDAVVVGAGTTGSAAAYQLAREGLCVALLDRLPFHRAGPRWVNGVAPWMFDRAAIPRPQAPELRGSAAAFIMHDRYGNHPLRIEPSPVCQVDMRLLVRRLQQAAVALGVRRYPEVRVESFAWEGTRPVTLHAWDTRAGYAGLRFHARLFVDASGLNGVLRGLHPELSAACGRLDPRDICSAAQEVRRICDRAGAVEFLRRMGGKPGENLSFMGVDGGFSTVVLQVHPDEGHVDILVGATAEAGRRSGKQLIANLMATEPWIGERLFGGAGAIPLRRPYDQVCVRGLALLGDAGCQVFPAHGSGIGTGLIAARILAETVGRCEDPGSHRALWAYQAAFMRELGAVTGAYDVFRRLSQQLGGEGVNRLLASQLMTSRMSAYGLAQRMPRPALGDVVDMMRAGARQPRMALTLLPSLLKMQAVYRGYRLYPRRPTWGRLALWRRGMAWLFAEAPSSVPEAPRTISEAPEVKRAA